MLACRLSPLWIASTHTDSEARTYFQSFAVRLKPHPDTNRSHKRIFLPARAGEAALDPLQQELNRSSVNLLDLGSTTCYRASARTMRGGVRGDQPISSHHRGTDLAH